MVASKAARKTTRIRRAKSDVIFDIVIVTILTLVLFVIGYPLIFVLSASFSDPFAVISGQVWLFPVNFTLLGYQTIFGDSQLVRSFLNSVFVTTTATAINLIFTVLAAYPLSVRTFYGRNVFMGIFTFTMFFGGGLIPFFLLIRNLGMFNTYWAVILPGAVSVFHVIIARTFFQNSIPVELYEAAELDGCSDIRYIIKILLPLSAPLLAVLVLFFAQGHWNAFFNHMIFLRDRSLWTFQIVLRNILILNQTTEMMVDADAMRRMQGLADLLRFSLIVVSSAPMLLLYPFIQKHFVSGVMIGSVKG